MWLWFWISASHIFIQFWLVWLQLLSTWLRPFWQGFGRCFSTGFTRSPTMTDQVKTVSMEKPPKSRWGEPGDGAGGKKICSSRLLLLSRCRDRCSPRLLTCSGEARGELGQTGGSGALGDGVWAIWRGPGSGGWRDMASRRASSGHHGCARSWCRRGADGGAARAGSERRLRGPEVATG